MKNLCPACENGLVFFKVQEIPLKKDDALRKNSGSAPYWQGRPIAAWSLAGLSIDSCPLSVDFSGLCIDYFRLCIDSSLLLKNLCPACENGLFFFKVQEIPLKRTTPCVKIAVQHLICGPAYSRLVPLAGLSIDSCPLSVDFLGLCID
ncbi:hypothetical protein J7E71_09670 [Mesobacillus foraminis]|uniref:hypothetical protein n=1 Tax=Mesobacillus foraminis TaxID=279826 RepID=UPI001BE5F3E9|nr:hypothetical protein [Mesobacillus foraminis]MBT2756221.1 hypothetical protein [Mesobacillus foraminis]